MAFTKTTAGTGSGTGDDPVTEYLSHWTVGETAGIAALVKIRDSLVLPSAPTLADGGAGSNTTAGVHYFVITWVTLYGESIRGVVSASQNTTSHHIISLSAVPLAKNLPWVVGRNVYITKSGAPAAATDPTNAQYFLTVANPATTLTSANNLLRLPQASLVLTSASGFASGGGYVVVTTAEGPQRVAYTGISTNTLTGCTGGKGLMATGGAVTQATIPDNTTTTYSFDIADGSLTATNPPTKDTAGKLLVPPINLAASQSVGDGFTPNVKSLVGGGAVYMEVYTGTVSWEMSGE